MLEQLSTVNEQDLGIGLQYSIQVGQGRSITFTAGFPLAWDSKQINSVIDKLAAASDRQALRYELHDREAAIQNMYHQVEVQLAQQSRYDHELRAAFADRGKHGAFRYSQDQRTKMATYDVSIDGLRAAILKAEKELEELRERCR